MNPLVLRHPGDQTKLRTLEQRSISEIEPLLVDILVEGKLVYDLPDIESMRSRRTADIEKLDSGVRRIMFPHIYHVSLTQGLWDLKQNLIETTLNQHDLAGDQPAPNGKQTI